MDEYVLLNIIQSYFGRKKLKRCAREGSMGFQGSFKSASRKFQGYFKKILRVFQGRLKGVSREFSLGFGKKLKGNFIELLMVF